MPSSKTESVVSEHTQEILREKELRRGIRTELNKWARAALAPSGQVPASHHRLLLSELEAVSRGETERLMVLMPPGSAKSTYTSVIFPAWWFTQHPRSAVIAASHTADLAEHFGRQVRRLIVDQSPRLGYSLAADDRAAARWGTSNSGEYYATGVRGPMAGRRADLAIIDDPIKSHAEAESRATRDHIWNWYRSDLSTRLKPGGRVVVIMTRWHEDDLGGRLLTTQSADWRTLRLPAIAEEQDPLGRQPGAALWPDWEDVSALTRKRAAVGERVWDSLFQQNPRPPTGAIFKVSQIGILDDALDTRGGRVVRAWDIAATKDNGTGDPDWTVGLKLSREDTGRLTVLDVTRLRGSVHEVNQAVLQTARIDGLRVPIGIPQDPGSAGKFMVQQFATLLAGYSLVSSTECGSKMVRAGPISAQVEAGNVAVVRARWTHTFLEELRDFPYGRKDDHVDALARAFAMLSDSDVSARRLQVPLLAR